MAKRKNVKCVIKENNAKFDISKMPENEFDSLCRATLRAVERFYAIPENREYYEKWLVGYRARQAAKEAETTV